jgi:hypothetical protein
MERSRSGDLYGSGATKGPKKIPFGQTSDICGMHAPSRDCKILRDVGRGTRGTKDGSAASCMGASWLVPGPARSRRGPLLGRQAVDARIPRLSAAGPRSGQSIRRPRTLTAINGGGRHLPGRAPDGVPRPVERNTEGRSHSHLGGRSHYARQRHRGNRRGRKQQEGG